MKRLNNHDYIWQYPSWPNMTWDSKILLPLVSKARQTQGKLLSKVAGLGFQLSREARANILTEEAVKTSAIEGERLNRDLVRSSIAKRLGLAAAGLPPSNRHIDGLIEVLLEATDHYEQPLTAARLKSWQASLFPTGYSGLSRIRVGQWRGTEHPMKVLSGPIGKEKIHYEAPPGRNVEKEMKRYLRWWEESLLSVEGLLRSGLAHFYFVTIHPFDDGNGRIARALTEMALSQDEKISTRYYSLSSQIMKERDSYYSVLEKSQKGNGDVTAWLTWYLDCYARSVEGTEKLVSDILVKAEFWQRHSTSELNERQRKVVIRLLDVGKGGFVGGLTNRKYVSMTHTSRVTAFREISELLEKGILVQNPANKGRSVNYDLK